MPSAWVDHVKDYAAKHKMSFSEAMKDPGTKSSYKKAEKKQGEKLEVEKVEKVEQKETKVKKPRIKKTEEQKEIAKQNKKEKKTHEKKEEAMGKSGEYSAGAVKNPEKPHKDIKIAKAERKPRTKIVKAKKE